jgi:protein ImuB
MYCCLALPPAPFSLFEAAPHPGLLEALAREFSPRVEVHEGGVVTLDIDGLGRLFGTVPEIGQALRCAAADRGVHPHVAIAATRTAAILLALGRAGLTTVPPGDERAALAPLALGLLRRLPMAAAGGPPSGGDRPGTGQAGFVIDLLRRWGLKTLGDLADLPARPLSERLGQDGVWWQRLARGEEVRPLVAMAPEEVVAETLELEWPVEGLEPLSFVLARLIDPVVERLTALDQAAVVLSLEFRLASRETERREVPLPAPMRDPKVLRTLILLHLESHPLSAGVDRVTLRVDTAPARITQFSLLSRALPFPEQMATLLARLSALLGERHVGAPALVDTHRPGAFAMAPFSVIGPVSAAATARTPARATGRAAGQVAGRAVSADARPAPALAPPAMAIDVHLPMGEFASAFRRFRRPVAARVALEDGRPVRVTTERRGIEGGRVDACAGPWRSSGDWWLSPERGPASPRVEGLSPERGQASPRVEGRSPERGPASNGAVPWNRDEWDVALADGAIYRLCHDHVRDQWLIDGIVD